MKVSPIIRFLPSLTDLIFLAPFVCVLVMGRGMNCLLEGDTGWHIRTGEWILQNGRIPDKDIFSFTKAGEPWFAWEWLWDVMFALLHKWGGMAAVILASLLVISLTMTLMFRMTRAKCNNVLIAFGVSALALVSSSVHWLARPHVFSWLFVLTFFWALERAREGNTRALWSLPLLTVLWTNIHASFFIGVVLIGTYAAGELAVGAFTANGGGLKAAALRAKPYLLCAAACFAASFVNPYGYHVHLHILSFLREPYYLNHIIEYQATVLRGGRERALEPFLLFAAIAVFWNLRKRRFTHCLLLLSWLHLGMSVVRNVPIFVILAAPLVAEMLDSILSDVRRWDAARWIKNAVQEFVEISEELGFLEQSRRFPLTSVVCVGVVAVLMYAPAQGAGFRSSYDPKAYPEAALASLQSAPHQARIFTDDEWGDFLIYRLFPGRKVFVDGRADFYGPKFGQDYLEVMDACYDWEARLAAQQVDTVLLHTKSSIATVLKESRRWRVIYDDGLAVVFNKRPSFQTSDANIQIGVIRGPMATENINRGLRPPRQN